MKLFDLISSYLEEKSFELSESTIDFYIKETKRLSEYWNLDTANVEDLTRRDVISFLYKCKGKNQTKNKHLSYIKTLLNYGLKFEMFEESKNIRDVLKIDALKEHREHFKSLDTHNLYTLINYYYDMPTNTYTHYRDKIMLGLCLCCGIRRSEVSFIKISDINFEEGYIRLPHTKNGENRLIYPTTMLMKQISIYCQKYKYEYLFCNHKTLTRLEPHYIGDIFVRIGNKVGFKVRIHDIRHTFATKLASDGVSVFALRDLMGHTNISTTQIYVDKALDRAKKASEEHNVFDIVEKEYNK